MFIQLSAGPLCLPVCLSVRLSSALWEPHNSVLDSTEVITPHHLLQTEVPHSCLPQSMAPWPTPVTLDSLWLSAHSWEMTEKMGSVSPGLSPTPSPSVLRIPAPASQLTFCPCLLPSCHLAPLVATKLFLKHNMIMSFSCKLPVFHTAFDMRIRLPSSAPKPLHSQILHNLASSPSNYCQYPFQAF